MMTKKQFAKAYLMNKYNQMPSEENGANFAQMALSSSCDAVCLDTLGLLDDEMSKYASARGGIMYTLLDEDAKDMAILSIREIIDMLPD